VLVYVPEGWIGEFHLVCGAHLFVLSIDMQAALELVAVAEAVVAVAVRNGAKFS
jgi:hypothetical protein